MIPIRDTVVSRNYPIVNNLLIALNIVIFMLQLGLGSQMNRMLYVYGLVPARYSVAHIAEYFSFGQQVFAFFSFMFLHGGFLHLIGNMWSLYIFGDNVEDQLGPLRYLAFYLSCGVLSGLSHVLTNWYSNVPTIGASGAIAGVMGAYFLLFPHARILTLIPILFIPWFVEIPAFFFLAIWFFFQFLRAAGSAAEISGIAWWAHIGGFICGMLLLRVYRSVPKVGFSQKMRELTARRTTPHLQIIHPSGISDSPDLYGVIHITPYEAQNGVRKLVNIPWGFQKRIFRVVAPAGIRTGNILRLQGMGRKTPEGAAGDLLLKVVVEA